MIKKKICLQIKCALMYICIKSEDLCVSLVLKNSRSIKGTRFLWFQLVWVTTTLHQKHSCEPMQTCPPPQICSQAHTCRSWLWFWWWQWEWSLSRIPAHLPPRMLCKREKRIQAACRPEWDFQQKRKTCLDRMTFLTGSLEVRLHQASACLCCTTAVRWSTVMVRSLLWLHGYIIQIEKSWSGRRDCKSSSWR